MNDEPQDTPRFDPQLRKVRVPNRLTIVDRVYHQPADEDPRDESPPPYQIELHSEEEPYTRVMKLTNSWQPLDLGWLQGKEICMILVCVPAPSPASPNPHLANLSPQRGFRVQGGDEVRKSEVQGKGKGDAEAKGKRQDEGVVEIIFDQMMEGFGADTPRIVVRQGESCRFSVGVLQADRLRVRGWLTEGKLKCKVTLYPA